MKRATFRAHGFYGKRVLSHVPASWVCRENLMAETLQVSISSRPGTSPAVPTDSRFRRPRVEGKFLLLGAEKYFIKGVTYGAFPPNGQGHQFPEVAQVANDFTLMQMAGINTILTYTVPPISLLDQAQEHGVRVIPVVPWMEYVCFLEEARVRTQLLREVREGVASCCRHPAVMMYCVGKEIPPPIVRWHGPKKIEAFLRDLYHVAKEEDPDGLVTYTNFPTTEYLEVPFFDVCTFNVYLHQRSEFCRYLSRLQHLAGERPLVLTELGICSFRHGREGQAAFLDWQIEETLDHGFAGAVIFGWTDPFFQDDLLITDWGFGLVDADRRPKPSYEAVRRRFTRCVPFSPERRWPKVSIVVAAHNAARTLYDCLDSLQKLRYPNYEVIVVNDGSTDTTEAIAARFSFRTINTANRGVSAARNEGLRAATGEIVAYIDSDARADPEWLHYLAATYMESDVAGAGGPNLVPPEDNWIAKCVYRSPGGPTQVMLDDRSAEHIPGCNMSFRKAALEEVGGFDPIFTTAADDVDICWRLLDKGYRIGFSAAAVVWHHRRSSVKGYWRQQVGYGISESILERKFPNKFNPWGHTFWAGRIYAPNPSFRLLGRPVIYHGLWGSAGFQPVYDPGGGGVLSFLPRAMEFHFALFALGALGFFFPWAFVLVAAGTLYTCCYCVACAAKANLDVLEATQARVTWRHRLRWRAMIVWLHLLEPIARDWGRLKGGLTPWRTVLAPASRSRSTTSWWQRLQPFRRVVRWSCPGNMALESYRFLELLSERLAACGCAIGWNPVHEAWDLKARRGTMSAARLGVVVEHHGGPKRLVRLSTTIAPPNSVLWIHGITAAAAGVLGALNFLAPCLVLTFTFVILWVTLVAQADRLETAVLSTAAEVADELQGNFKAPPQTVRAPVT